jgi:hypothetical protein
LESFCFFFFFLAHRALEILKIIVQPDLHGEESLYALQAEVMYAAFREHSAGLAHLAKANNAL